MSSLLLALAPSSTTSMMMEDSGGLWSCSIRHGSVHPYKDVALLGVREHMTCSVLGVYLGLQSSSCDANLQQRGQARSHKLLTDRCDRALVAAVCWHVEGPLVGVC